jgi:iron complex outermembrane recepter protein
MSRVLSRFVAFSSSTSLTFAGAVVGLALAGGALAQDTNAPAIKSAPVPAVNSGAAPATSPAPAANPEPAAGSAPQPLPPVVVPAPSEPKQRKAIQQEQQRGAGRAARTASTVRRRNQAAATAANANAPAARVDAGFGGSDRANAPQQVVTADKTGTRLEDIPANVQIIPRELLTQQGAYTLSQAMTNASGVNVGGQDSLGYFDHFLIRGLNAQVYQDNFSDGDQLGGLNHSLNGVKRIEVIEGPGSTLFGSGPPGGTINIVHYQPLPDFHWGTSLQAGSFGTVTSQDYVTGPTTIKGLNYRVDATGINSDGYRGLGNKDFEIRPDLMWNINDHVFETSLDARRIHQTPDSYGLIYFNGSPISNVSAADAKYSTPWAFADQTYIRPTITDKWTVTDFLTINNRFAYTYRDIDAMRNGDSTRTTVCTNPATQKDPVTNRPCILDQVIGRQLREQTDRDNTFDYQFEPLWQFNTGPVGHSLLTGFEAVRQTMQTQRQTADLPNIANVFDPIPPELSASGLKFQCDASHSCDNDNLSATYLSVYATDQMDIGERLKLRAGVRQDWWNTVLDPLVTVPGAFTNSGQPIIAGVTQSRNDAPVSWNVGALYKLFPGVSPYAGVSKSFLTNFNSENVQNGIGAPESALQYEAGIKFNLFGDRLVINTAFFDVSRNNVATPATLNGNEVVVFDAQRTIGTEASIDAAPLEPWHILANATFQNAVITDNPQGIAAVGNHPQGVPAYLANLWTTYKFSIAGVPGFMAGGGINYQAVTYSDTTNINSIPAYAIGSLLFAYTAPNWSLSLNVKNITNERYFVAANVAGAYVGNPLSAYVTLRIFQ